MSVDEEIKKLELRKVALQEKSAAFKGDYFLIYGTVKELEDVDRKISKLKNGTKL